MIDGAVGIYTVAFLTGLPIGLLLRGWLDRRGFDQHADDAIELVSCYCGGYAVTPEQWHHSSTSCGPAREYLG